MKGQQGFREIIGKTIEGVIVSTRGQVYLFFPNNTHLEIYIDGSHIDACRGIHRGGMADILASLGKDVLIATPELE